MWRGSRVLATRGAGAQNGGMEPRVKSEIWVSMALRLSNAAGRPAAQLRKGDPDSGGFLCVLLGRGGGAVAGARR